MFRNIMTALAWGSGLSLAVPVSNDISYRMLVGTAFQMQAVDFKAAGNIAFDVVSTRKSTDVTSWLLLGDDAADDSPFYAVNEWASGFGVYDLDASSGETTPTSPVNGSLGLVHLAYNWDKSRIVAAGYGSGNWDVYDMSKPDEPSKMKTVSFGEAKVSYPHMSILDPSGRYFVIPDLGLDKLHIVDADGDKFEEVATTDTPKSSGPRHGVFVIDPEDNNKATQLIIVTEYSSELILYDVTYGDDSLSLEQVDKVNTWGDDANAPKNPTGKPKGTDDTTPRTSGGEIQIASNMRDVYVSSRNRAEGTADTITHFKLQDGKLEFSQMVPTGGTYPRHFSLSKDEKFIFSVNQGGDSGLVAIGRCGSSGKLTGQPVATLGLHELVNEEKMGGEDLPGPQFVQQI